MRPRILLVLGSLCSIGLACGPSFQVIYEGDARFEHCYALDETPTVSLQEKSDCWTQWMKHYTYGQTRNRVDYAASRASALAALPAVPTDESLMSAAPGEGPSRSLTHDEPVPTNAFAPPPKTALVVDGGPVDGGPLPLEAGSMAAVKVAPPVANGDVPGQAPSYAPKEHCTDKCRTDWQACRTRCSGVCKDCDTTYGTCMKRCF